ncbi:MAG: hypothetical protein K6T99_02775 [Armatimonadetes bacterium]|nr:hypothetical protein [Armatimonadota bacterium]
MRLFSRFLVLVASLVLFCLTCVFAWSEEGISWQELKAKLAERRKTMKTMPDTNAFPGFSQFKGKYLRPEYASQYRSFVKLNPQTGLLEYEGKVIRPFFTVYSQPKPGGGWVLNIPDLDFDLLEKDFARMKQAGINVQPRFWSWAELLNPDGTWREVNKQPKGRGLPYFKYVFQIYDYFLDRAQAHGLYVNIEPSFYWGLAPEVIPAEYRGKILLYDELWDAAVEAYSKILNYFSRRTVIVAVMIGEEDLVFDHCLSEPIMLERFKRYQRKTYGTISNLQRAWRWGYDYDNPKLEEQTVGGKKVLYPIYPMVSGKFDSWKSFDDVRLPLLDYYRSTDSPNTFIQDMPTYQRNLLQDPIWIDFMQMKEEILIARLNQLADALRKAAPNHILYYSNPYDFNPAWHFLHCFDRARLRFDVIGVGQHDSGLDTPEVPQWATCREYVQNVASYGPYICIEKGFPRGFACGEGEGGRTRDGTARYYPWWLTDIVGGGGAFFQSYHWNHIAGRSAEKPTDYDSKTLEAIQNFLAEIKNVPFSFNRNAEVLILRSKHAAYGMSAGYDYGNARYLASILYQLHISFDILPDSDITPGSFEEGKVNLNKYRFIFVPCQYQLPPSRTWQMLFDWLTDPRYAGRRGLCLGWFSDRDCYFNPIKPEEVHPAFCALTGTHGYSSRVSASGKLCFRYARFFGSAARGDELEILLPQDAEIGCFDTNKMSAEPILTLGENEKAVVVRNVVNGNSIYTCGFPLGIAYDPVWGAEKEQTPNNALLLLYQGMMSLVDVKPALSAPDNLGVYVSDDRSAILLKERFGRKTEVVLKLNDTSGIIYQDTTTAFSPTGETEIRDFTIEPYGVKVLRKVAAVRAPGISIVCKPTSEGGLECELIGRGKVSVLFELKPMTIYSVRENGELSMVFTADGLGRQAIAFDLSDGVKPLHVSVKPSQR